MNVLLLKLDVVSISLIISPTMKFEEFQMRESSWDHFGKRGLVAYGGLLRHNKIDGSEEKRVWCAVPESDGTQDCKATSRNLNAA